MFMLTLVQTPNAPHIAMGLDACEIYLMLPPQLVSLCNIYSFSQSTASKSSTTMLILYFAELELITDTYV